MDPNSNNEIVYEFPRLFRLYKDGRVERFMGTETIPADTDPQTGVQSKDVTIDSETGVSARLYLPKTVGSGKKLPLLIYIHGGAFCIGSPFNPAYHKHVGSVVSEANAVAISVHYRLAPEHRLPIAYDDTWAAIQWAASHIEGNGPEPWLNDNADFERVFFAGDSAGANLAHNMAMRGAADGFCGLKLRGMVLIHPFFGNDQRDELVAFLFPTYGGTDDQIINPGKDPKLSTLACPRVLILVAGRDFLRDRSWSYYEALKKSGWGGTVDITETEGEDHVFHLLGPGNDKTAALVKQFATFITQN